MCRSCIKRRKEVIENSRFWGEMRFIDRDDVHGPQGGTGEHPGLREPWKHLWRRPRTLSPYPPPLGAGRGGQDTGSSIWGGIQLHSVQSRETPALTRTVPKQGSFLKKGDGPGQLLFLRETEAGS